MEGLSEFFKTGNAKSAAFIQRWAENEDDGRTLFVQMLCYLFMVEEGPQSTTRMKLKTLKEKIQNEKFLVFLDELPAQNKAHFELALCMRDTPRYLGVAPTLMSTHAGSQNHVERTSRASGRASDSIWTHVLGRLPCYSPCSGVKLFLKQSERPLVLQMAVNAIQEDESMSLRAIVRKIRTKLQKAKRRAWTMNPALQLVLFLCTDIDINKRGFSVAHDLVGHHFGHLDQRFSGDGRGGVGAKACTTTAASAFGSALVVAPVSAKYEPLLYLALVAWEEAMLKQNHDEVTNMFPLVDERDQALTVREAFVRCSNVFTPRADVANLDAQKMNGDVLEALVHASVTLASMRVGSCDKDCLPGVPLLEFLPLVRRLMLPGLLRELPKKCDFFDSIKFDWPLVPALGGSDSSLPVEIAAGTGSVLGFLSRPEDQAKVDGYISNMLPSGKTTQEPFMHVECKNYADGVTASVLNQVFKRIKSGVQCSMIFVSNLKGKVFLGSSLAKAKQDCFAAEHDVDCVTVLCWGSGADDEPGFLKIGGEDFKAKTGKTTKLLVVIFQVECVTLGSVHEWDVSRKRKRPPCAKFPLESSQESVSS